MLYEILRYIDCFGTKFNFYTEKSRKFYTPLGGVFSLLAIFFGIIVFIFFNLEDFLHTAPITSTSISRENYNIIKFGEEKIWIPWRIRDYNNRMINHTNLFYPKIYYYRGIKNETNKKMELSYNIISYRLCNETSFANRGGLYMINISLDNLYCIDMEELEMGGNWQTNYINYLEFDLYICKDGIDYNETNIKCSSFEKIIEAATEDNSFEMEVFYPMVYYQPTNKSTPIFVKYTSYFYHFSRYSNKIDRLFLQKYILSDDDGWFSKKITNYSYWGCSSISGDSYTNGDKKDLMNEGSSSRLYSFNIYLTGDIIVYNRSYKKMFLIIADRLPIVNIVCIIFSVIAKIFKISSGTKKLTELLFENLKEKPNKQNKTTKINNEPFNILKMKGKSNHQSIKKFSSLNKNFSNNNIPHLNNNNNNNLNKSNFGNTTNNNINDVSSSFVHLSPQNYSRKKLNFDRRKSSVDSRIEKIQFFKKSKNIKNNLSNIISNGSFNNNINVNYYPVGVNNNNININIHNNMRNYDNNKSEDFSSINQSSKLNAKKKIINDGGKIFTSNNIFRKNKSKKFVKVKLFPYKFYLFSIFIKNVDLQKKSKIFTKKFINVYNFICQLFDISSYLILQREFQIIKNTLGRGKYRAIIENREKINVNDHSFYTDMKECLDYQRFSILGRVKNSNEKKL